MKTSFIVDIDSYIILLTIAKQASRHDTKDAKPLLKKLSKYYNPKLVFADRGYDSNEIFEICFEELEAYPLILQKRLNIPKHRRKGAYRKLTFDTFDYGQYLQRNKIETCNSMFKKRFGSNIKSRLEKLQRFEALARIIAYNIDRLIKIKNETILIFIRILRVSY